MESCGEETFFYENLFQFPEVRLSNYNFRFWIPTYVSKNGISFYPLLYSIEQLL